MLIISGWSTSLVGEGLACGYGGLGEISGTGLVTFANGDVCVGFFFKAEIVAGAGVPVLLLSPANQLTSCEPVFASKQVQDRVASTRTTAERVTNSLLVLNRQNLLDSFFVDGNILSRKWTA